MYVIKLKSPYEDENDYLKEIEHTIPKWRDLKEAKIFTSEQDVERYLKDMGASNDWIKRCCKVQYMHPLNIPR